MRSGSAALRIPVRPADRAYLKALRQAELAAWQATEPRAAARRARAASTRLPAPTRDSRESWLYVLLSGMCLVLIGYELWTKLQSAGNWSHFVHFVRQLVG